MESALSNPAFHKINRGEHLSRMFDLPQNKATAFVSTHFELGHSDLLHYHDEPHLTFILNGAVCDKRKNFETETASGELMFFHAGEPHQTISKIFPTRYFSLQFNHSFYQKHPDLEKNLSLSIKNRNAYPIILNIYKELSISDEFSGQSVEMLLTNLIDGKISADRPQPLWFSKVVELLNEKWNDEISVQDLAIAAEVHPKTISKYFPRYFNCTLGEYRRKIKIEKAIGLIKTSKMTLTEIAYECGFYDQSHFTATFKSLTGFLPKQFQKI